MLRAVAYGGGVHVAGGANGAILRSTDGGTNWAAQASGTAETIQGLHYGGGTFVAVGTGTALIFLRPTQAPWFSAKLAAVGLMAALHVAQSTLVLRLFRPGERVAAWRLGAAGLANAAVVLLILLLVLAKPGWSLSGWKS